MLVNKMNDVSVVLFRIDVEQRRPYLYLTTFGFLSAINTAGGWTTGLVGLDPVTIRPLRFQSGGNGRKQLLTDGPQTQSLRDLVTKDLDISR